MGRHREFDLDQALDAALDVFWRKGYEAASYTDLTQAIGVERPALYSAFGNKEALFLKALARYYERYLHFFQAALALPTSYQVVQEILLQSIQVVTHNPEHPGCLGVHGALAGADDSETIRRAVFAARAQGEQQLKARLDAAIAAHDLPADANSEILAAYVCAVVHGMAVQAKAGFEREKLIGIAQHVLATWPGAAR